MTASPATDPDCHEGGCRSVANFRLFHRPSGRWQPICERHALALHPSLELGVLLESGYLRPVELDPPAGEPGQPATPRGRAFKETVEELLGWTD